MTRKPVRSSATRASPRARVLEWDSRHFGVTVARLEPRDPVDLSAGHAWCTRHRIDTAHVLVPASSVGLLRRAEELGFVLVDVRVELQASTEASDATPSPVVGVRSGGVNDLAALIPIARRAHHGGRFHVDGHLSGERADAMYVTWLANSLDRAEARLLVAELRAAPVGYAVWSAEPTGEARLELIAVLEVTRREGVGRALTVGVLREARSQGIRTCRVVTQGGNAAALRLYQQCGFELDRVGLWYHRWYRRRQGRPSEQVARDTEALGEGPASPDAV